MTLLGRLAPVRRIQHGNRMRLIRSLKFLRSALVAALVVLSTGACTVSVGSSTADKDPLVKDDKVTLDFRTRPTRETLHLPKGSGGQAFAATDDAKGIDVTVLLPGGQSTHIKAYRLATVTATSEPDAKPSQVVVNTKFASQEDFAKTLWAQKEDLGLEEDRLNGIAGSEPGSPDAETGTTGSGSGVIAGLQKDFLTVDIDVREGADTPVANYSFAFDLPIDGGTASSIDLS